MAGCLTPCIFLDTFLYDKRCEKAFGSILRNRQWPLPVREWLLSLSNADRQRIGADIAKVEFGWPIGLPSCRPMRDGLFEVRSNLSDGRIGRVLFGIAEGSMVLLHGFIKKSQATPKQDLELARKRLRR